MGGQGPREFMELSVGMTVEEAVKDYLDNLDFFEGIGSDPDTPEDLQEALMYSIERYTGGKMEGNT